MNKRKDESQTTLSSEAISYQLKNSREKIVFDWFNSLTVYRGVTEKV